MMALPALLQRTVAPTFPAQKKEECLNWHSTLSGEDSEYRLQNNLVIGLDQVLIS